jgi:hypothetical protein
VGVAHRTPSKRAPVYVGYVRFVARRIVAAGVLRTPNASGAARGAASHRAVLAPVPGAARLTGARQRASSAERMPSAEESRLASVLPTADLAQLSVLTLAARADALGRLLRLARGPCLDRGGVFASFQLRADLGREVVGARHGLDRGRQRVSSPPDRLERAGAVRTGKLDRAGIVRPDHQHPVGDLSTAGAATYEHRPDHPGEEIA